MTNQELAIVLQSVANKLERTLSGFSQEQLNLVPAEGGWSAGQVGEHLLKSYEVVQILQGDTLPSVRPQDLKAPEVKALFLDFSVKMSSPKEILPSDEPQESATLIEALKSRLLKFADIAANEDLTPVCTGFVVPEYGAFTKYEWLFFQLVHTLRHLHQIGVIHHKITTETKA